MPDHAHLFRKGDSGIMAVARPQNETQKRVAKMPRKPPPVFEVIFSGPSVYPEVIPLGTLSRILSAVHRLATASEPPEEDEQSEEPLELTAAGKDIQLLDVKRGSAVLRFSGKAPGQVLKNLREVGLVLRHPERIGENIRILGPIEELSATARRLNCSIIIKEPTRENGELATIEPASYEAISTSVFVTGETAITGFVERVGGATVIKCGLRVPFQTRMLICRVAGREVARMLGERVYQEVIVQGVAKWVKSSWRLYAFEIRSVQQLKTGTIAEAMEAMRDAGGSGWDKIEDPEEFLEGTGSKR